MSDRRRRKVNDTDSQSRSEESESENDSGNESEGTDADESSPPNYDDAVQLETENKESANGAETPAQPVKKGRGSSSAAKDPAVVPRSERFFLHDNRDEPRTAGTNKGTPRKTANRNTENSWKHDKFEELVANEPERTPRSKNQKDKPQQTQASKSRQEQRTDSRADRSTPSKTQTTSGGSKTLDIASRGPPKTMDATPNSKGNNVIDNSKTSVISNTAGGKTRKENNRGDGKGNGRGEGRGEGNKTRETQSRGPPAQNTAVPSSHPGPKLGDYRSKLMTPAPGSGGAKPSGSAAGARSGLPAGATVHAKAPNTKSSAPVKAPPGLDASLNPSARVFEPTDEASSPSNSAKAGSGGGRTWKYGADPATYSYKTQHSAEMGHSLPTRVVSNTTPVGIPAVQQTVTVTFRNSTAADASAAVPVPPSQQQVSFKEHSPMVQYPDGQSAHGTAHPVRPLLQPSPADYLPVPPVHHQPHAAGRHPRVPTDGMDMYTAHMAMQQQNMYRQGGVAPGAYGMPMNMAVYDPQMMYMGHDPMTQMGHYGDPSMWYGVPQSMIPGMGLTSGVSSETGSHTGGTVYYPLPSSATNQST